MGHCGCIMADFLYWEPVERDQISLENALREFEMSTIGAPNGLESLVGSTGQDLKRYNV